MKYLILLFMLIFSCNVISQNNTSKAFKASYINETNQDYQNAIDDLLEIYVSSSYVVNLRLGWLYYKQREYSKSTTHYNNAISLQKNSIEARFGIINPMTAMGNTNDVKVQYQKILKIDHRNSRANYYLGYLYFINKDWGKAEILLKRVLMLYPFDYNSNVLLGKTYVKNGKLKEAKEVLNNALYYNPQSKEVMNLIKGL